MCVLSRVRLFVAPQTVACQAPLSMEFSRQEYWSGLHALLQEIFPIQGSNQCCLCLLHCKQILHCLSYHGGQRSINKVKK